MSVKAAVLGSPILHSLSPVLHRAAYKALGLNIEYTAIETSASTLRQRISELNSDFLGYSLTMPLKQEVLALISQQSPLVTETGCANTVYRDAHLDWALQNTDVFGITETIRRAGLGPVASACIIGSGATARSALSALAQLGAQEITCFSRNQGSASIIQTHGELLGVKVRVMGLDHRIHLVGDLVISTVPSSAQVDIIQAFAAIQSLPALLDIAYNPWPSEMARYWAAHSGGLVLSGIEMLLWQATVQVELFTGRSAPIEAMRAALLDGLSTV